jgi:hypothetical protein
MAAEQITDEASTQEREREDHTRKDKKSVHCLPPYRQKPLNRSGDS